VAQYARFLLTALLAAGAAPTAIAQSETAPEQPDQVGDEPSEGTEDERAHRSRGAADHHREFREVNRFFNLREANPDVHQGEWLVEVRTLWNTRSDGSDDDVAIQPAISYGVTDDLMVELDVMAMNLGDGGGQGNGDLALTLLYRFMKESETLPAVAGWSEMRIPTGDGSSGVDASFNVSLTKTLVEKLRLNLGGGVETLNGARGDEGGYERPGREFAHERFKSRVREHLTPFALPEIFHRAEFARSFYRAFGVSEPGRRSFRWNVAVGLDYALTPQTIGLLNYLHRSSEEEGLRNQHILEVGVSHALAEHHVIKAAFDIGLTGAADTPNFEAKIQYGFSF
jgi:hypothetical protein